MRNQHLLGGYHSKVKARLKKTTHKYGIGIPTSIADDERLDYLNGNRLWQEDLEKEMFNIGVAFQILEDDKSLPVRWKPSSGHIIWDVKLGENFRLRPDLLQRLLTCSFCLLTLYQMRRRRLEEQGVL